MKQCVNYDDPQGRVDVPRLLNGTDVIGQAPATSSIGKHSVEGVGRPVAVAGSVCSIKPVTGALVIYRLTCEAPDEACE